MWTPYFLFALSFFAGCADRSILIAGLSEQKNVCDEVLCSNHGRCVSAFLSGKEEAQCLCFDGFNAQGLQCEPKIKCEPGTFLSETSCLPETNPTEVCPPGDSTITDLIANLGPNESLFLDPIEDAPIGIGHAPNMFWRPSKCSAIYAGSTSSIPSIQTQDVWSYHLGTHSWTRLFKGDGGQQQQAAKGALLVLKEIEKPNAIFSSEEEKAKTDFKKWWKENVVFEEGHITTTRGGPVFPNRVYDAMDFDPKSGVLFWGANATLPQEQLQLLHHWATGTSLAFLRKNTLSSFTKLWGFTLSETRWSQLQKTSADQPRDMGETISIGSTGLWSYGIDDPLEMWRFDLESGVWEEQSLGKEGDRLSEGSLPTASGTKTLSISESEILFLREKAFIFNEKRRDWERLPDPPFLIHFSHTILGLDLKNQLVIAFDPRAPDLIAVLDLQTKTWSTTGPLSEFKISSRPAFGYFDANLGVLVVSRGRGFPTWVYRYR